mgnify:CR=1 FL=1
MKQQQTITFIIAGPLDQPTGGYRYDARIIAGLRALGWRVAVVELPGRFPLADDEATRALERTLSACEAGSRVVIDGLAGGGLPDVVGRHAARLSITALVHHPLCDETGLDIGTADALRARETETLSHAACIITPSRFTRERLHELGLTTNDAVVIEPGVEDLPGAKGRRRAPSTGTPWRLLCVATLIPRKGHAVLVEALAQVADLDWQCAFVGATDRDPEHTAAIETAISRAGLSDRITLHGAVDESRLDAHYADADLFVLASHYEGYGMVITEAIAHALPVVTTTGGALAHTLPAGAGRATPPGDADALATALRTIMTDRSAYTAARQAAQTAGAQLGDWPEAARAFAAALQTSGQRT